MYKRRKSFNKKVQIIAGIALSLIAILMFFLAPHMAATIGLSTAILPVWGFVKDNTFKELSVEEIEKLDTADAVKYFNELNLYRAKKLDDLGNQLKKESSDELKSEIQTLKETISNENKEQMKILQKAIETQGLAITKLMHSGVGTKAETLEQILKSKAEELKELSSKSNKSLSFTVDKATVLTPAVADSTLAYRDPNMGTLARARNVIRQLFSSTSLSPGQGGTIRWVEYVTDTNGAAWQTEGALKGEGAMTWVEKSKPLQVIAEWIKVSRQMISDFTFVAGEIRSKLLRDLESKVDASLFSGTGTAPEIEGVYTAADTYTPVASGITDANIYDLVVKVIENIKKDSDYQPNYVLMNISDINQLKLKKDANNNYMFRNEITSLDGITVVESSKVTANTLLVGDFDFASLYNEGGVNISMGYENQDFTKNLVTILAEERLALVVKGTDTGAFNKVTDIAAARTTLGS